ncbi:urotensin 2 domain containing isoform X1 [Coregonus clupeaformis]|uniref:urotensin 2 domain containing isoform X1 n=1 Tax=Coregonus clupeaformis TaxID=59861 RepID=UPI001BDFA580|nr:urotensin 2 domain containing isoform X1 [Coregonus clupeaformis]
MDSVVSVNYWLGLLAFLLLQGVVSVEGRSIFNPDVLPFATYSGNHVYPQRGDTDAQNKILALLLHKSLEPIERNYALGLELANKLEELEEIEALKEDLELERELSSNTLAEDKSIPRKRGEPCFWKYCV